MKPGDLVVIVGTKSEPTAEGERGKVLGLMEPTNLAVMSLDYALEKEARHFNEHGEYRWPFGLELKRAWCFSEPRVLLTDISKRRFGMAAAQGIVPLTSDEASAILALPREEVGLLQPIQAAARVQGAEVARKKAAPPPSARTQEPEELISMRRLSPPSWRGRVKPWLVEVNFKGPRADK